VNTTKLIASRFGKVNLFKATNESGKWVDIVPFFNSKSYSTGNPSIDREEKYFILHLICLALLVERTYGR
jgi:hypothetical protein